MKGRAFAFWEIRASTPTVDSVRTKEQLQQFSALFRQVLHDIRRIHGPAAQVHIFPAVPNSVAIECGRVLLPKPDPAVLVYDRNRTAPGFTFALDLLAAVPEEP